jgi:hypothetical protein
MRRFMARRLIWAETEKASPLLCRNRRQQSACLGDDTILEVRVAHERALSSGNRDTFEPAVAWDRFERAVDAAVATKPMHRRPKQKSRNRK